MRSRAIPRQDYAIARHTPSGYPPTQRVGAGHPQEGEPIGFVTSGTFSPTLGKPIGMGYVPPEEAREGTSLEVLVRERPEPAVVVPMPFYRGPGR